MHFAFAAGARSFCPLEVGEKPDARALESAEACDQVIDCYYVFEELEGRDEASRKTCSFDGGSRLDIN
jgi:hypothetical protein